jgi:hypothetical protein
MDVLEVIRNGHDELRQRLCMLAATAWVEPEEAAPLIRELIEEFAAHHEAEERILFRRLAECEDVRGVVNEAWEEHAAIDLYLQRIKRSHASVRWSAKTMVLRDLVELNMAREENRVFALAEELLSEGRDLLGARFEEERQKRLALPLVV